MHTNMLRFILNVNTVVVVIVSIVAGIASSILVGEMADSSGMAFLAFLLVGGLVFMICETKIAMMGMQVEQAENIKTLTKDIKQILYRMEQQQYGMPNNPSSGSGTMLEAAAAQGSVVQPTSNLGQKTIRPSVQPSTLSSEPSRWTCKKCLEENDADAQFCAICGSKKSY